ncbi:hypothetical protein Spa11_14310 [Botrimarina mediterranea]|uniref:Uncharacterized protein n=1 Tax=Botrimarina mediterranea TaxID=2528022 RepID=A0A518K625_9BACT|nr:hypothetical protein Spa11_14310 [Botrimarina mediterranea]
MLSNDGVGVTCPVTRQKLAGLLEDYLATDHVSVTLASEIFAKGSVGRLDLRDNESTQVVDASCEVTADEIRDFATFLKVRGGFSVC